MAATPTTLMLAPLTAITDLTTLSAACLSAPARGTTGAGADADGVAAAGVGVDTTADADITVDVDITVDAETTAVMDTLAAAVLMAAERMQVAAATARGRVMAAELAAAMQVAEAAVT